MAGITATDEVVSGPQSAIADSLLNATATCSSAPVAAWRTWLCVRAVRSMLQRRVCAWAAVPRTVQQGPLRCSSWRKPPSVWICVRGAVREDGVHMRAQQPERAPTWGCSDAWLLCICTCCKGRSAA